MAGTCFMLEARLHLSCSHGHTAPGLFYVSIPSVTYPGSSADRQTLQSLRRFQSALTFSGRSTHICALKGKVEVAKVHKFVH
jgi:hypothetical protein